MGNGRDGCGMCVGCPWDKAGSSKGQDRCGMNGNWTDEETARNALKSWQHFETALSRPNDSFQILCDSFFIWHQLQRCHCVSLAPPPSEQRPPRLHECSLATRCILLSSTFSEDFFPFLSCYYRPIFRCIEIDSDCIR